jgi:hypothetical protein
MQIKFFGKKAEEESKDLTIVITECPACKRESGGEVCMHCGETLYPKRITFARLLQSIPDVFFDIESGLFYTARTFLTRPGTEIRQYFGGDRAKHYKPLKFILFIGGLYTFLFVKFDINNGQKQSGFDEFGLQWNSVILLFQFPLIALTTWLLYRKRNFTYGEHLVANAFIIAEVSIYKVILFPLYYLLNGTSGINILEISYLLFILVYYPYAFYDWFYQRKTKRGLFISIVFVVILFIMIQIFTYILQLILYYLFNQWGWA